MKFIGYAFATIGFFAVIAFLTLVFTYPLMWAINYLVAPHILAFLFGVAKMGFWKTYTLSFISSSLFARGTTGGKS
jgi:hypothetical protein